MTDRSMPVISMDQALLRTVFVRLVAGEMTVIIPADLSVAEMESAGRRATALVCHVNQPQRANEGGHQPDPQA